MIRRRRSITALLAAGLLAAGFATPALGASGEGPFSAQPSPGAPQDKAGTFFRLHVERGTARRQSVVVENLSNRSKHLLLDAVDGRTGLTSGSVYENREDPTDRAGAWLKVSRKNLYIPPRRAVRVPFEITVPASARTGDHLAGIAVQDARRTRSESRMAVTQVVRIVVGVQIIVDGPREPAITLGKVDLQALPGSKVPSVVVGLENTGTRLCKPTLDVTVTDEGSEQRSVSRRLDTVLPGNPIAFPLAWPNPLQAGTYDIEVQAKGCGDPQATRVSAQLGEPLEATPDAPDGPPAPRIVVTSSGVSLPTLIGLLVAFGALGAGLTALVLRRRRPS